MLLGYVVQVFAGTGGNRLVDGRVETDPVMDLIIFPLMLGSAAAFYIWFWMRSGQTLGMLAWRIKLQSGDGSPVDLRQALIRWLAAWPCFFLAGLGYLWLYVDANGDALHDRLSHSRVVLLPKSAAPLK